LYDGFWLGSADGFLLDLEDGLWLGLVDGFWLGLENSGWAQQMELLALELDLTLRSELPVLAQELLA
jgi:hypothetical protein